MTPILTYFLTTNTMLRHLVAAGSDTPQLESLRLMVVVSGVLGGVCLLIRPFRSFSHITASTYAFKSLFLLVVAQAATTKHKGLLGITIPNALCFFNSTIIVPCYPNGDPLPFGSSKDRMAKVAVPFFTTSNN
jgi:hypothetical protein